MPVNDALGKRMKEFYENRAKTYLMRREPVILRVDGRAFHSFTKGFERPFDERLLEAMRQTMLYLCSNIQGAVFGYTQSDEISLVLVDYKTLTTDAFFDNEVQKICSIVASMATLAFNKFFQKYATKYCGDVHEAWNTYPEEEKLADTYIKAINKGAMFDCRCFNIPKEEVCNYFYWRQLDATRNSIQMVAQANFSHNELQNKSCNELQDMLFKEKNINWNDYPPYLKRGTVAYKKLLDEENKRPAWVYDLAMPVLKGDGRKLIDNLIFIKED